MTGQFRASIGSKPGFVTVKREIYATASLVNQAKQVLQALMDGPKPETDGTGVDAIYEMSGSYHAYADALHAVRMGGEIWPEISLCTSIG